MKPANSHILTINGGSSSIKFALYEAADSLRRILEGAIERIGLPEATLWVKGLIHADNSSRVVSAPDHTAAVGVLMDWIKDRGGRVGAVEADLPSDLLSEIATRSWLLASLFQKLGYVGRCSFDSILVGESLERSRVEFIECNGRWGGTSLPMSLMNRIFGDSTAKPYAVRTIKVERLNRISFSRLCELLNLELYDRRTGQGRLVLTTPGLMHHQSAIAVLALGDSRQDATEYVEKSVPALLRQIAESDAGTSGSDDDQLAASSAGT